MSDLPPSPADFEAAVRRVEQGISTQNDARIIREYVGGMGDEIDYLLETLRDLRKERESSDRFMRALNEAFNSGSGAYIP